MAKVHNIKDKEQTRRALRRSATVQEVILWSRIKEKKLGYKFRRQHSIGRYIVDFYCPTKKLIIEIDGCQHQEKVSQEYDKARSEYFESLNLKVLRFWNNDINKNLEGVITKILEFIQ